MLLKEGHLLMQDTPRKLMQSMENKVWSLTVSDEALNEKLSSLKISNMLRDHDGVHLRIIGDERPGETAVPVQANLEDVFLYHFGEGEQW